MIRSQRKKRFFLLIHFWCPPTDHPFPGVLQTEFPQQLRHCDITKISLYTSINEHFLFSPRNAPKVTFDVYLQLQSLTPAVYLSNYHLWIVFLFHFSESCTAYILDLPTVSYCSEAAAGMYGIPFPSYDTRSSWVEVTKEQPDVHFLNSAHTWRNAVLQLLLCSIMYISSSLKLYCTHLFKLAIYPQETTWRTTQS